MLWPLCNKRFVFDLNGAAPPLNTIKYPVYSYATIYSQFLFVQPKNIYCDFYGVNAYDRTWSSRTETGRRMRFITHVDNPNGRERIAKRKLTVRRAPLILKKETCNRGPGVGLFAY